MPTESQEESISSLERTVGRSGRTVLAMDCVLAGAHWRSDAEQALLLGEAVTISVLRDQRFTYNEPFSGFTFTKFDGSVITV